MAVNGINGTNGVAHRSLPRAVKPGIYAPIPTFFKPNTEDLGERVLRPFRCDNHLPCGMECSLDIPPFEAHVVRLAKAGVNPLLAGSMGEGHHLTHRERSTLIRAARRALDAEGLTEVPIIAGTGAGSTRETVELCKEAASAGADSAIVIASGYFAGVLASHKQALKAFWREVAQESPIPVIIYNCQLSLSPPSMNRLKSS